MLVFIIILFLAIQNPSEPNHDRLIAYPKSGMCPFDTSSICPVDIGVLNVERGEFTSLPVGALEPTSLSWSPNGSQIAFASLQNSNSDIGIVDLNGSMQIITDSAENEGWPVWSPDGEWIAFTSDTHSSQGQQLFMMRPDGSERTRIVSDILGFSRPVWSPDSSIIAFVGTEEIGLESNIYLVDVRTRVTLNFTRNLSNYVSPIWSPDGNTVAFVENQGEVSHIYTLTLGSRNFEQLTHNSDAHKSQLYWSPLPEPGTIIFSESSNEDERSINSLNLSSGLVETIVQGQSISGYDVSNTGAEIVYIRGDSSLSELCIVEIAVEQERCFEADSYHDATPQWSVAD